MNQEELAEIKQMWGKCRGRTIRIVDQDQMDRLTFELHNKVPELLAHIDAQAVQIKVMKEKLVEERARAITSRPLTKVLDIDREEARQQLAQEMQEVFGNG